MTTHLELNAWINSSGASDTSWPRQGLEADRIFSLDHYIQSAEIARRGVFSNVFMSDRPQLLIDKTTRPEQLFDPAVLFSAVLSRVPDIGAIITATTSYSDPYTLARSIQSLNLLFPGRIGWNIVTSWHPEIAANFSNATLPDRDTRYDKAEEFVDVVLKLWESWEYPWGPGDLKSYGTPQAIDHQGPYFSVKGPLNLPRAPWGRPKLVQAGGSVKGVNLGARHADYIYAPLSSRSGCRDFRTALHTAARGFGRGPGNLPKVLPTLSPVLFSSEAEIARFKREWAESHPLSVQDLNGAAFLLGVDRSRTPDHAVLTEADFGDAGLSSLPVGVVVAARRKALDAGLTLAEFAAGEKLPGRISTPEETVHFMLDYLQAGAVDGFTISSLNLPDDLAQFVDQVVPLLQRAGHYPTDYRGLASQAA